MRRGTLAFVGALAACGPAVGMDGNGGGADATSTASATSEPESQSQSDTGATTATSVATTIPGDTSTTEDPTSDDADWTGDDGSWLSKDDIVGCFAHCPPIECSLWEQDCLEDEKCVPWANDGGDVWTAHKCVAVERAPALVGEPCVVVLSGVSGLDDCQAGSFCWGVDPESLEGECVAMCAGSEDAPVCPGGTECVVMFDEALTACLPPCDPLAPSCGASEACMFTGFATPEVPFACLPTPPFGRGNYGDPCDDETLATCDTGLVCVTGELVPGCADTSCCTLLGDVDAPPVCPDPQQSCVPFERESPEHCVCVVPE